MTRNIVEFAGRSLGRWSPAHQCTHVRRYAATPSRYATPLPITAAGPPPSAPQPEASSYGERIDRKRRQATLLQKAKEVRATQASGSAPKESPLRKRFWKDVHVSEVPGGYQVMLDSRPVRTPSKEILLVPKSKLHLAHAIAIEWDLLVSAQQALKNHNIPMTSIVSRAQDIADSDRVGNHTTRNEISRMMMRYLDTDTLLCWAPERSLHEGTLEMERDTEGRGAGESLRQIQMRWAKDIIAFLNATIWPGVEIKPVLEEDSILPARQSEVTRSIVSGWIAGLPACELAALERAVLATKSLLIGARLIVEWSEEFRDAQVNSSGTRRRFGVEEAAEASTIEVRWQTGMWGEVDDTHDVDREDVRRQLGSAVLVVSGAK